MLPNWLRKSRVESYPRLSVISANWKDGNVPMLQNKELDPPKARKRRGRDSVKRTRIGAYFNTMEYIFKALRFVACLPISVDKKNGTVEFRIKSLAFVFTVIVYAALSVLVWVVVEERFQILKDSSHSFDDSVVAYVYIIYFCEWPLLPFIRWFWQTPRLLSFMTKWRSFEDQFEKVTGASLVTDQDLSKIVVVAVVISIPLISLLVTVGSHYIIPLMSSLHLAAYWVIGSQMYLNSAFVWATSRALEAAARGLVRGLRRDAGSSVKEGDGQIFLDRGTRRWPQDYMELWRKLSIMVRSSGSGAIGPAFILNIGKEFPNMLLAAYGVIAWLDGGAIGYDSGVLLILIHHLSDLVLLGNSAHIATQSAGSDIRDELSLMMVNPKTNPKVKKEIRQFLQLMDATPPSITVGGFFTLDKEFVSKLMGTMVTYLVVLLQFRHAMHAPTIAWHHNTPMSTNATPNELENGTLNNTATFKA